VSDEVHVSVEDIARLSRGHLIRPCSCPRCFIRHHGHLLYERARVLRSTIRDFGGERRRALLAEIEALEAGAKNGRNLYLCAVCGTWGTWGLGWQWWGSMDDAEAYVCSDDCKARFKPARRARRRRG